MPNLKEWWYTNKNILIAHITGQGDQMQTFAFYAKSDTNFKDKSTFKVKTAVIKVLRFPKLFD